MELRVLGPVTIVVAGRETVLGRTREAAIVADLVVHAGQVVPSGRLIDDLWRGVPPTRARATLQTYVRNVRRLVDPGAVVTRRPGYRLDVSPDCVDASRFEGLLGEGRAALVANDLSVAGERLRDALGLWRGAAFGELASEPYVQPEAARLEELRIVALEERVETDLRLGNHRALCAELEGLVVEDPYRERLWGQWMLALYRAGRQADALRAYQRFRHLLGDELGIEPGTVLVALEEAILLHKPDLDWVDPAIDISPTLRSHDIRRVVRDPTLSTGFDGSLVGRDREIERVRHLLSTERLVSLLGVGGVGKTCLALAAAEAAGGTFVDGVWFCDLAAIRDAADVAPSVAETLGVRPQAGVTMTEVIVRALAQRRALVVLDNCEHLIDTVAQLATVVRDRCQRTTLLATSREALGVAGEQLVEVLPLDTADAVTLFLLRAHDHLGEGRAGGLDRVLVSKLCDRLDGLPLAIELAAARTRSMVLPELARRLQSGLQLLSGPHRIDERHRTLRATVGWSYDLLTPDEQRLFSRLSVFAGSFDIEAAEVVCVDRSVASDAIGELLVSLVEKSMVVMEPDGRYRLLETMRHFANEGLPDDDYFRRAHLAYFTKLTVMLHDGLQGAEQLAWRTRLHAEWSNIRAAFSWARSNRDVHGAAIIVCHLLWAAVWHDVGEPYAWADDVAAMAGARESGAWHDILAVQARAAWECGRNDDALRLGLDAIAAEPDGSSTIDYFAEYSVLAAAYFNADGDLARRYLDRAIERARNDGRPVHESVFWSSYAIFHAGYGRAQEALTVALRARELAERIGNPTALTWALSQEGIARAMLGDPDAAIEVLEYGLALGRTTGSTLGASGCIRTLAWLKISSGDIAAAMALTLEDLQAMRRRGAWMFISQTLFIAARELAAAAERRVAAVLLGAVSTSATAGSDDRSGFLATFRAELANHLDPVELATLIAQGQLLAPDEAAAQGETALTAALVTPPN